MVLDKSKPTKDTPIPLKDKIFDEIEKQPWIHQQLIIENTTSDGSSETIRKYLVELEEEGKIYYLERDNKKMYVVASRYKTHKDMLKHVGDSVNDFQKYVHTIKDSKEYSPKILEYLDECIPKMLNELKIQMKSWNHDIRQNDNMKSKINDYNKTSHDIDVILDKIKLEGNIRSKIICCQNHACVLFERILSISNKLELKKDSKKNPERGEIVSRIGRLGEHIDKLALYQSDIKLALSEIERIKPKTPEFVFTDFGSYPLTNVIKNYKDAINNPQKKYMKYIQDEIGNLKQKTESDKSEKISSSMTKVQKDLNGLLEKFEILYTSMYELEANMITDEHLQELYRKLDTYEKNLQVIDSDLNSNLEFDAKK